MQFYKDYSWQPNAFLERATIEDTTVTYALVNPKTKRFTSQTAKKTEYRKATHYDNDSYILEKAYYCFEHWLIQFSTKYHLSYMGAVSELLKQLDSLHSYDLLNQYAMKSLTIAPDNPKAYCWLIRSLKAQGMNELATNELAAAKEHLTTEEYEEILAFGANW